MMTLSLSQRRYQLTLKSRVVGRKAQTMKTLRITLSLFIVFALLPVSFLTFRASAQDPQAQNQATAIMRGYRTGYSDGYQAGISDAARSAPRDFRTKAEYDHADRAYNSNWGPIEDYRDGYRQGFEVGYEAGFDHKPFDSTIPTELKRRTEDPNVQYPTDANKGGDNTNPNPNRNPNTNNANSNSSSGNDAVIPRDTIMRVELMHNLSTDVSQKGDPFQARVLEPKNYEGAIVDGHVEAVKRPGKAKGTAQMQLSFDRIQMPNGPTSKFSAQVIEVIPNGASEGVDKVDSEGGVKGKDSTKDDVKKVGAATGVGAVLGAILGGGSGAAIGATIGAGVGTAGVLNQRGNDIRLYQGQQLRIRTAGDTEFNNQ
jgi:hypothetical protein